MEELLAWMSEAYILLSTKERDPIPDDLNTVETLYKEHVVGIFKNMYIKCVHSKSINFKMYRIQALTVNLVLSW